MELLTDNLSVVLGGSYINKMKQQSNYNKFLLLWSGELVSAIGSGLTISWLGKMGW